MTTASPRLVPPHHAPPIKRRRWWQATLEAIVVLCVCVAALEGIFRYAGLGDQEIVKPDAIAGFVPISGKHVTWRKEGFSRMRINSLGMVDVERTVIKPAKTFRIAVLGDSLIESYQVDRKQSMCYLLEKFLNQHFTGTHFEVLNFGVSAYNLGQMYIRLKTKVLDFKPDLVLLPVRGGTTFDLIPRPNEGFFKSGRPSFFVSPTGRLIEDRTIQNTWSKSMEARRMRTLAWVREHSCLWGVVSNTIERVATWWLGSKSGMTKIGAEVTNKQTAFAPAHNSAAVLSAKALPPTSSQDEISASRMKCIKYYWPVADAVIREMNYVCRQHHCQLIILRLQSTQATSGDDFLETRLVEESAKRWGIPFGNTCDTFVKAAAKSNEQLFIITHLSEHGQAVFTDAVESFLCSLPYLKKFKRVSNVNISHPIH